MNQDQELREQISKIDGLARELFEQQFRRCGGRKDGDPTWDDLEPPERDEYWDRALDVAPLLAERDEQITLLKWLHAEASWWLQLDRDEHESAEVLHNWATRVAYLEARVGYLKNTIGELRAEVERLRREVEFEACGADSFSGADAQCSVRPEGDAGSPVREA